MYMEDVNDICSNAVIAIEDDLREYDIRLSDNQINTLWDKVQNEVEELAGYPEYRNYN